MRIPIPLAESSPYNQTPGSWHSSPTRVGRMIHAPRAVIGLSLILAVGCHRAQPASTPAPVAPTRDGEVTLKIVNHGRLDVVIFVVHGGTRERLGESIASATRTFQYSMRRLGAGRDFYLFGDPIGSTTKNAQSETILAENGLTVIWTLEDDLRRSSIELR